MEKVNVLMCCSDLSVQGGMVSVLKNYLNYENWGKYNIIFVPTHVEKNKLIVAAYFALSYLKICKLLKKEKIEIAHLHTAERGSFYRKAMLVRLLKKHGVKTVMHHHAAEFELFYNNCNEKQKECIRKTLELTDLNIVLSKRLVPMITEKAHKANVQVLYNAVPTYEENPYNINAKGILFLGRLGKRKGTYDLLSAIKKIDTELNPDISFYLCGDGEVEEVKKKIVELGLSHRIKHVGWIEKVEKDALYPNIMLNVLPSYNEGLPMSILETMAYGIPNISTKIASIPEVLKDGDNGYLIEPGDVDSLANRLLELCSNASLRSEFSNKEYTFICENFSLNKNLEILKTFYAKLV